MGDTANSSTLQQRIADAGVRVVNLIAGPRSGKTSIILATIDALRDEFNIAVILADGSGAADAERISAQGIYAAQVGQGDAQGLQCAIDALELQRLDLVIVEGASAPGLQWGIDVAVLSAAEGISQLEGRVPDLKAVDAIILNKADVLVPSEAARAEWETAIRAHNAHAPLFPMAATKDVGVEEWASWLASCIRA